MIPRFNYTIPLWFYIKSIFWSKDKHALEQLFCDQSILYYTNFARTGLRLLLSSISKKKLRVGVQVYTCHTVFQAIKKAGHEIVFLDIDREFRLDLKSLDARKNEIDILIVTHTFGNPERFDRIKEIIGQKIVIEDCSHAFMSRYRDRLCGTLGDASIFSFGLGKFPPIGFGGCVLVNNIEKFPSFLKCYNELPEEKFGTGLFNWMKSCVLAIVMHRPLYGITYRLGKRLDTKFDFVKKFSFHESKGGTVGAKLLNTYVPFIQDDIVRAKNKFETVSKCVDLTYIQNRYDEGQNYYITPLLIDNRDEIYDCFLKNKIEVGKHFQKSLIWANEFGYKEDCPNAHYIVDHILTLPLHSSVGNKDIKKICNILSMLTKTN